MITAYQVPYLEPLDGDPERLAAAAARYTQVAEHISRITEQLNSLADSEESISEAADAFRAEARKVASAIAEVLPRYETTAAAVREYAAALADAQSDATAAIDAIGTERNTLIGLYAQRDEIPVNHVTREALAPEQNEHLQRITSRIDEHEAHLAQLVAAYRDAQEAKDSAAAAAADRIVPVLEQLNDSVMDTIDGLLSDAGAWLHAAGSRIGQGMTDAGEGIAGAFGNAVGWTTERADDISDWWDERVENIEDARNNVDRSALLLEQALQGTAEDGRPQVTAVGAAYLQYLGAGIDAFLTSATLGTDIDMSDDGEAAVGDAIKYNPDNPGQVPPTELRSLSDLMQSVTATYDTNKGMGRVADDDYTEGYVRVTKVIPPESPSESPPNEIPEPVMVVSIPGTQPWFHWNDVGNDHPADWIGNLIRASGGRTTYSDSVALAIDEAKAAGNFDDDVPIMLVGHSQGGMTAADLGSDPDFLSEHNVTDIVAFGSPIENDRIDEGLRVAEFAHESDIVPQLDLKDIRLDPTIEFDGWTPKVSPTGESTYQPHPTQHTSVTLPDPESAEDAPPWKKPDEWHSHREYSDSVDAVVTTDSSSAAAAYENEISRPTNGRSPYLYENSTFEVYDVPVKRTSE